MLIPKKNPIRDKKHLEWLKTQPCIITGHLGDDYNAIDPMHIGTLGKGIKSGDDEALPVLHSLHHEGHLRGEMSMFRRNLPDHVLRAALKAYARELYRERQAND